MNVLAVEVENRLGKKLDKDSVFNIDHLVYNSSKENIEAKNTVVVNLGEKISSEDEINVSVLSLVYDLKVVQLLENLANVVSNIVTEKVEKETVTEIVKNIV